MEGLCAAGSAPSPRLAKSLHAAPHLAFTSSQDKLGTPVRRRCSFPGRLVFLLGALRSLPCSQAAAGRAGRELTVLCRASWSTSQRSASASVRPAPVPITPLNGTWPAGPVVHVRASQCELTAWLAWCSPGVCSGVCLGRPGFGQHDRAGMCAVPALLHPPAARLDQQAEWCCTQMSWYAHACSCKVCTAVLTMGEKAAGAADAALLHWMPAAHPRHPRRAGCSCAL